MSEKDGGFAFPVFNGQIVEPGMSLRDYFAAKALSHSLARETDSNGTTFIDHAARNAYEIADAMLKAREL